MAEIFDLSATDASNTGRWPENMALSSVNNAGRADEGILARHHKDVDDSIIATGGTEPDYTVAATRTISSYHDGLTIRAQIHATSTGAVTLNVDSVSAENVVWNDGSQTQLGSGDLIADQVVTFVYDLGNTVWVVESAISDQTAAASTTAAGIVELATTAETQTGTDTTRAVTPDGLHDMTSLAGAGWFLDEDDLSSDDATKVASQQSIKAYVDAAGVSQAVQADIEAETNEDTYIPPDLAKHIRGVAKLWGQVDRSAGTPSLNSPSYNITSVADDGAANTAVTIATDFSTAVYAVGGASNADGSTISIHSIAAGAFDLAVRQISDGSSRDTDDFSCWAFGDHA